MENGLWNYRITPRVLKKNAEQVIVIEGLDDSYRLYDGVKYEVKLIARDGFSFDGDFSLTHKNEVKRTTLRIKSENGVLRINYKFDSDGIWYVHIRCLEQKHCTPFRERYWSNLACEREMVFSVFVLDEDLYGLIPFKGDMHMHTYGSDGDHSPALMAARYRKHGFDFISITDHYTMSPSLDAIETFKDIPTEMKLFPGEEVHHPAGGLYIFHVVNFNPEKSVNALLQNDLENIEKQIKQRATELENETVDHADAELVAWYEWIYGQIKKAGGIAIYPHPYWEILETYNVRESTTKEIYKRGLCDVIEMFGGTDKVNNRMQAQLYYALRDEGYKYPVVASSDAHSSVWDHKFSRLYTIAFAKDKEQIPVAVRSGKAVAIENLGDEKNVYGDLKLVQYAWFLISEYYTRHDELCNAAGQAIERYVFGDKSQKILVELAEKEISKYDKSFFGKEI